MTTIYVTQGSREDGGHTAWPTQNDAKDDARKAYEKDGQEHHVMKVELTKDLGLRELMCALHNGQASLFAETKTVIYTAPARRGRKSKDEPEEAEETTTAEEDNPFGI